MLNWHTYTSSSNEFFSLSQVKVTNILSAIDAAEYLITHNASHVVKQVQDFMTDKTLRYALYSAAHMTW